MYSMSDYMNERFQHGSELGHVFVQVRIYKGQTTACARLSQAWVSVDGIEMWKLELIEPFAGTTHYAPCTRVRPCSGVGSGCTCQAAQNAIKALLAPLAGRGGAPACGEAPRPAGRAKLFNDPMQRLQKDLMERRGKSSDVLVTRHFIPVERKNRPESYK